MPSDSKPLTYAPKPGTILCAVSDVDDPGARGFVFGKGAKRFDMFIVRKGDQVFGYVNSCPHLRMPLETLTDRFLNKKNTAIVCSTHGATFRIADGYCYAGPCARASLVSIPLEINEGQIEMGDTIAAL